MVSEAPYCPGARRQVWRSLSPAKRERAASPMAENRRQASGWLNERRWSRCSSSVSCRLPDRPARAGRPGCLEAAEGQVATTSARRADRACLPGAGAHAADRRRMLLIAGERGGDGQGDIAGAAPADGPSPAGTASCAPLVATASRTPGTCGACRSLRSHGAEPVTARSPRCSADGRRPAVAATMVGTGRGRRGSGERAASRTDANERRDGRDNHHPGMSERLRSIAWQMEIGPDDRGAPGGKFRALLDPPSRGKAPR
jgi:hypothetical protein